MIATDALDFRLLNEFQRGFPLVSQPWAALSEHLNCSATEVMARLVSLQDAGKISRVGPVFAPNRIGASTLAAMAVPESALPQVAMRVSSMVAMWQIAESWWRSVCMSRLYLAASWGSILRA